MSDKIYLTVTYEIEPSGYCSTCDCKTDISGTAYCKAFDDVMFYWTTRGNLPACREYLEQEKAKVYCDGCMHFWAKTMFGELEPRCAYDHEQEGEICNYYSKNCTDREE